VGARNPRSAQLWASGTLAVAVLTSWVVQGLTSPDGTSTGSVLTTAVTLLAAGAGALPPARRVSPFLWLVPVFGVGVVVHLDLSSGDAGVTGQVFFVVPVIWAAANLRAGAVVLVTAATVAGHAVVVTTLLPPTEAVTDLAYVTVLVLLLAAVLTRQASRQERLVERLRMQADLDPLTGLVTRRVLDRRLAALAADPDVESSLVLVDLDRFKQVNDTHGHQVGDAALCHVADAMRARSRSTDLLCRLGGDELAVLLPGCPPDEAADRARVIVAAVGERPLVLGDGTVVALSISAGSAALRPGPGAVEEVYARADAAMYAAKHAGRGRAVAGRWP
jgi:diguanylate cyclase (GGDEF)-like protein